MKALFKAYPYLLFWILGLIAFIANYPIVGFAFLMFSIPSLVRGYFQVDKRDKLIAKMVELINEQVELEEMLPLVSDAATTEKITKRLAEIEIELKEPVDGLIALGFLKKTDEVS